MAAERHTVLGIMSGSSLDGIDLAICDFNLDPFLPEPVSDWSIRAATTIPYSPEWKQRLRPAGSLPATRFWQLHSELGDLIGKVARTFLDEHPEGRPTLVGCHGHTVFHEPASGYSVQLGEGSQIAYHLDLPVVTELRAADIAAGGQGAPLAPVADRHLFPDHATFLNLGGIANFSVRTPAGIVAGDVSGCCQIFDRLARLTGLEYDDEGELARSGQYLPMLAAQLEAVEYHAAPYPKSLSNDWVADRLWPLLSDFEAPVADRLHTFARWLANRIVADLRQVGGAAGAPVNTVSSSGGGVRNRYFMECLNESGAEAYSFQAAEGAAADFKEAALIALCALFRQQGIPNSIASATGARHDTVNGALYVA